jgi:hypothetical protein
MIPVLVSAFHASPPPLADMQNLLLLFANYGDTRSTCFDAMFPYPPSAPLSPQQTGEVPSVRGCVGYSPLLNKPLFRLGPYRFSTVKSGQWNLGTIRIQSSKRLSS